MIPSIPLQKARNYEREWAARAVPDTRPLFHLTPQVGWMNDPNGFCFYQGQFHLFYQYHPYSTQWGPMHWGHAVSDDLLRWQPRPCALAPDTPADKDGCFSGSAIPLPDGRLLLAYTGVTGAGSPDSLRQNQCIAIGDGTDFEKSPMNPVLPADLLPEAFSRQDFRDPKIWQEADGTYRMVTGNRHRTQCGTILLFRSLDALHWQLAGEIDSSRNEYGQMWECPDLFLLNGTTVLLVSPQEMRATGEFHPGYGTVVLTGTFDESACRFTRKNVHPIDCGFSFYAPQTTLAPDGRRIMIGWMENWETCAGSARPHPWFSQMSLPRELSIQNGRLLQRPVREIETFWQDTKHLQTRIQGEMALPGIHGRLTDLTVSVGISPECRLFSMDVAKDASHYVRISYESDRGELVFDRSHCGTTRDIVHIRRIPVDLQEGRLTLRLVMDRESIELFIGDGEKVITSVIPPSPEADGISFFADEPTDLTAELHHLV